MLPISIKHIRYNFSNSGSKKNYIIVHDTGNKDRGADDISHYKYFDGAIRNASAHYFVDMDSITETVDPKLDSWHCGDGHGKYGITNQNSIGVEICVNSDGDYNKSVHNAIDLVKYLMVKFNIPLANVRRHYDASHKICPASMASDNWYLWNWFKLQLIVKTTTIIPATKIIKISTSSSITTGTVIADVLNVRKEPNTSSSIIGKLNEGDRIKIGSTTGEWLNIYFGEHGGYVFNQFIELDKVIKIIPKATDVFKYATVIPSVLNVRSGNGTTFAVIGQVVKNQKIKLDCKKGEWWSIYFGDHGGYVHGDYLKLI